MFDTITAADNFTFDEVFYPCDRCGEPTPHDLCDTCHVDTLGPVPPEDIVDDWDPTEGWTIRATDVDFPIPSWLWDD